MNPPPNLDKDNILYIDDEIANLDSFSALFWTDYNIHTALDTTKGYQILKTQNIKVVITDQRMPNETGLNFILRIKPEFPDVVFMILTGYADMNLVVEAINTGCVNRFIMKPWHVTELKQAIKNGIDNYNLILENRLLVQGLKHSYVTLENTNQALQIATNSLIEKEEKYRLLFENVQNGFAILKYIPNKSGKVKYKLLEMNPAFERHLNNFSKTTNHRNFDAIIAEIGALWSTPILQVMNTGKTVNFEHFLTQTNRYISVQIFKHSLNQFAIVVDDITSRKKAEIQLNQSEKRLNAIFENAPMIMVLLNQNFEIVKINQPEGRFSSFIQVKQRCGDILNCISLISSESTCGKGIHCTKCQIFDVLLETYNTGISRFKVETALSAWQNGQFQQKTFLLSTSLIVEEDERFLLATFDDITERKTLESELQKARINAENSEQQMRMLANITFEGILIHKNKIIFDVNNALLNLTQFDKQDLIGQNIFETLFSAEYHEILDLKLGEEYSAPYQVKINRKNQPPVLVELEGRYLVQQNERLRVVSVRDISERILMENQVLNAVIETEEKEKARFAQEIHDGLGPILSNVQMYFQWMAEETENRQFVYDKGSKSLKLAFQTLREISNNLSPHILQNFGLAKAIANFIDQLPKRDQFQIEFENKIGNLRLASKLETGIYRIITELVNNGIKYAKASRFKISLARKKNLLALSYSDNGIGFNLDETLNKGNSYGLININNRVKMLNGIINFKSELNVGTEVNINFHIIKSTENE